jgi:hypothetical protein
MHTPMKTDRLVVLERCGKIAVVSRTRRLLNTDTGLMRLRLEAELNHFVSQVQTQQALDGIDHFLRRQAHE